MKRVLVHFDRRNFLMYEDGRVVEEKVRYIKKRFRNDQWPLEHVSMQYDVPVEDPELIDRVRREVVRLQNLGRTTLPAPRQLAAGGSRFA